MRFQVKYPEYDLYSKVFKNDVVSSQVCVFCIKYSKARPPHPGKKRDDHLFWIIQKIKEKPPCSKLPKLFRSTGKVLPGMSMNGDIVLLPFDSKDLARQGPSSRVFILG